MTTDAPRMIVLALSLLIGLGYELLAADPTPTPDAIQQAIADLGANKLAVREKASELLWRAGAPAEDALQAASKSTDAEVRYRSRAILEKFRYGIFADTPTEIVDIIYAYRNGDPNARKQAVQQLQAKREVRTIMVLLKNESDENLRRELQIQLSQDVALMIAPLLLNGEFEKAEPLLEVGSATDIGRCQLAAYYSVRGQLDKRIAELNTRYITKQDKDAGRLLVFLQRAKGELAMAANIAKQLQDVNLESSLLSELRDWKSVARLNEEHWTKIQFSANYHLIERLGYTAAHNRLAGNQADFQKAIDELKQQATQDPQQLWFCAEALLLNDQPEEALKLLRAGIPGYAFQLLAFQHRFREAFDFVGLKPGVAIDQRWFDSLPDEKAAKSNIRFTQFAYALQVLRTLQSVGRKEDVAKLIELLEQQIAKLLPEAQVINWAQLAEAEYRAGLSEKAFEHLAKTLTDPERPQTLRRLFGTRTSEAEIWWKFFRRQEEDEADLSGKVERQRLMKIENVLKSIATSLLPDDPLRKLALEALEMGSNLEGEQRTPWIAAIAETCAIRGHRDLARKCFERIADGSSNAVLRLGDLAAEEKNFAAAAEWYLRAWQQDQQQMLALYLAGVATELAGQPDAGRKLKHQADLIALNVRSRVVIMSGLQSRDYLDAARQQAELILLTCPFGEKAGDDASKILGDIVLEKEPQRAADLWERITLACLRTSYGFISPDSYLRTPFQIHKARAAGWIARNDKTQAQRELQLVLAANSGDVSAAEELVPALDKAGWTAEAKQLFDHSFASHVQLCQEFPASATHHNNLAWLASRCNRELDAALEHSTKALELSPNNAAYLDTLGEVQFRRGDRAAAIESAKKCIDLNPKMKFYHEQLERYQK